MRTLPGLVKAFTWRLILDVSERITFNFERWMMVTVFILIFVLSTMVPKEERLARQTEGEEGAVTRGRFLVCRQRPPRSHRGSRVKPFTPDPSHNPRLLVRT
jgi:hypothetical protein